jgi:hypothetical protein
MTAALPEPPTPPTLSCEPHIHKGASKNPKARNLLYGIECDSEKPRDFIGTRHEAAGVVRFFRAAEEAAEDAGFS